MCLRSWQEVLEEFQEDLLPSRLCDYVYRVSIKFAELFRDCRVTGSSEQSSRLLLCSVALKTLRTGFQLLGIDPVSKV
jgi:arginyl-tRNA synthetase